MSDWFKTHRIAVIGVFACLLVGGAEVMVFLLDGLKRADLNSPIGMLAQWVASWFTEPPSPVRAGSDRRKLVYQLVVWWQAALTVVYCVLVWIGARLRRGSRLASALMAVQMMLGALGLSGLLYVLAAQLALAMPLRRGLRWLGVQLALLLAATLYIALFSHLELTDDTMGNVFMYFTLGTIFQLIVFGGAHAALRERATRVRLATANAALLATQAMLADTVRAGERTRIARDLHDAVGHHLTALNLHLDLALRQADSAAPPSLLTSRELARSLLSEVRDVVTSERSAQRIDLGAALATLCAGIPSPAIRLNVDPALDIASPALAHTLFFCTQEALTNAVRHAGAREVTIEIRAEGADVTLLVADDGGGARGALEGNGLRGMRERVAQQGGKLLAGARPGGGFGIDIALPLAGSPA
jgi:two-component system sensor histidine kinase DesK